MSLLLSSDKEYKATKLIKQGKEEMNSHFKPLATWINETYGVRPLNIIYDTIGKDRRPRLEIIFEYVTEAALFNTDSYMYDEVKQAAITRQFEKALFDQSLKKKGSIWNFFKQESTYRTNNLFVIFSAFDSVAKADANESIPESRIRELKQELKKDQKLEDLWEISRFFSGVTFFFYNDKQVEENSRNGIKELLAEKYYDILKPYDEFDYFNKNTLFVYLDSKENFDNNYQSNWYYYYK